MEVTSNECASFEFIPSEDISSEKTIDEKQMDPLDHLIRIVVDLVRDGGLDFLDPASESACTVIASEFQKSFRLKLKDEFGDENGLFLHRRYQVGNISPKMRWRIDAIRDEVATTFRKEFLASHKPILEVLFDLLKSAFYAGGLQTVDAVLDTLNERLAEIGCRFLIGPGTACMEGEEGKPIWLALIFSRFENGEFICLDWCRV